MPNPFDYIEDYLDKKLSTTNLSLFEQSLNSNTDLANEVRLQKQVRRTLKSVALREKIVATTADIKVEPTSYKWLFVGATICLFSIAAGFAIWKFDDSPQNIPSKPNLQQIPTPIQPQNAEPRASVEPKQKEDKINPTTEITQSNVEKNVTVKNFSTSDSIQFLIADATPIGYENWQKEGSQWRGNSGGSEDQSYFEAYKNLKNGQYSAAKIAFKSLAENTSFRNFRRAQWYLTLAELSENPSSTNKNLDKIINTNGHFFQQKAKALKRFLEKNGK